MIEHTATRYHPNFAYYSNDLMIGGSLKAYGEYAELEVGFLLGTLENIANKPRVVYDIGGNIGYHATAFASLPGTVVHSWEPNPLNYAMLRENTKDLGNVTLHRAALSNITGTTRIETFDPTQIQNYGEMHINSEQGVPVSCYRLDDLDLPLPHLIKIDVEGFEWEVISGASTIIAKSRPLIYYEALTLKNFDKIHDRLINLGYELYWATIMNYNQSNFKNNQENIFGNTAIFNVIAYPSQWTGPKITRQPVLGPNDDWQRFCG